MNISKHPLYQVWAQMLQRCNNPSCNAYGSYGGRGITVCDEWSTDFRMFLYHMGERPSSGYSIERLDNDYIYAPENCLWASPSTQAHNKRNNLLVELDGVQMCAAEAARILGCSQSTIRRRLENGVSIKGRKDPSMRFIYIEPNGTYRVKVKVNGKELSKVFPSLAAAQEHRTYLLSLR